MKRRLKVAINRNGGEGRVGDLEHLFLGCRRKLLCMRTRNELLKCAVNRLNKGNTMAILMKVFLCIGGKAAGQLHKGRLLKVA